MQLPVPFDRITVEPEMLGGQPCIRGMKITVRRVLKILAAYPSREELFQEYPEIEEADICQALKFAAENMDDRLRVLDRAS